MSKRQREIERRFVGAQVAPVELRAGMDEQPPELHGYAAVFNQETQIQDFWGDVFIERVAPGAYAKTIGEADIRALFNHDENFVLGRKSAGTLELREDTTGLHVIIRPPENEWGRPIIDAVRRGDITGQSIGFRAVKQKWERPEKDGDLPKRTILEAALRDVSIVTYPAFEQTSIQARSVAAEDGGDVALLSQAFGLARMAEHGYPLAAEDRALIGAAVQLLQRVSVEPGDVTHSTEQPSNEPGGVGLRYSLAERERRLRLLVMSMEMEYESERNA